MNTEGNGRRPHTLELKVRDFITKESLLPNGCRVIVGVSGGADSVALLRILLSLGYDCHAVHCNFRLRGDESERDCRFTEELCRQLGTELTVCGYDTSGYASQNGISIEMAARELRYRDFGRIMKEQGAGAVCIAHHQDDSVETVLLNLTRGTGLKGLTGIKPRNGDIVRPLLCASRKEIETYLTEIGQPFITDSSNLETDFTRNRIRLMLLPLMREINPSAGSAILSTARHLQQAYLFYTASVAETRRKVVSERNGNLEIDIDALRQAPSVEGFLFEILSPAGFNDASINGIAASLDSQPGTRFLSESHILLKDRGKFILMPLKKEEPETVSILTINGFTVQLPDRRRISVRIEEKGAPVSRDADTATFDADMLPDTLTVRQWRKGDWFIPFGMKGRRLVSDFMTDRKMNLAEKHSQLVVTGGDDIVWVLGMRTDNRYRVTERTLRQLILTVK